MRTGDLFGFGAWDLSEVMQNYAFFVYSSKFLALFLIKCKVFQPCQCEKSH